MLNTILQEVKDFREKIYRAIRYRRDATFELLDSLCSNVTATSPMALSLSSSYRRKYSSITDSLSEFHKGEEAQKKAIDAALIEQGIKENRGQQYLILATDVTPCPRKHSPTLADRTYVYHPNNIISGNKPVTIGHKYSTICLVQPSLSTHSWVLPLSTMRVSSQENDIDLGAKQLNELLATIRQQAPEQPIVNTVDSAYSKPEYIHQVHGDSGDGNVLTITRLRSNRVLWKKAEDKRSVYGNKRGHERWYGEKFSFKNTSTWHQPDETLTLESTTKRGKPMQITIQRWDNMVSRDKRGVPMHQHALTLLRIVVTNEHGEMMFHKPMWLGVYGTCSVNITTEALYQCYLKRYDIEQYFRFQKQKLMADKLQTPEVTHAENWWVICMLAYAMLFVSRNIVAKIAYPWETYLNNERNEAKSATPSMVQRQFGTIASQIGTPARLPKFRGKPLGRKFGTVVTPRLRRAVIIKGKSPSQALPP